MIDGRSFLNQPVKNDLRICENTQKITIGQGDDYRPGCLIDYPYFKKCYTMKATDLNKQHALDVDPKSIQ